MFNVLKINNKDNPTKINNFKVIAKIHSKLSSLINYLFSSFSYATLYKNILYKELKDYPKSYLFYR